MCYENSWNDIECQSKRNWICKIAKGVSPSVPPTDPPKRGEIDSHCGTEQTWVRIVFKLAVDSHICSTLH